MNYTPLTKEVIKKAFMEMSKQEKPMREIVMMTGARGREELFDMMRKAVHIPVLADVVLRDKFFEQHLNKVERNDVILQDNKQFLVRRMINGVPIVVYLNDADWEQGPGKDGMEFILYGEYLKLASLYEDEE